MPNARKRGIAKWIALLCSVVIIAIMAHSAWHYTACPIGGDIELFTQHGQFGVNSTALANARLSYEQEFAFYVWFDRSDFFGYWRLELPIWPAALLTLLWACFVWRHDIMTTRFGAPKSKARTWLKWRFTVTTAALTLVWLTSTQYDLFIYN